ncbi:unnamed protein product, partial [Symbiodinium sp. CCMP2456]
MGVSHSSPAMENQPEQEDRGEEMPEEEEELKETTPAQEVVPEAETGKEEPQGSRGGPTPKRITEKIVLPSVDRTGQSLTAFTRPEETSTPTTGTKSKAERKEAKKSARKEDKRNRKLDKVAKKAEESEMERESVRRKLDKALENAGCIESIVLLEKEYKALRQDPSHRPNFHSLIDQIISNFKYIPRTVRDGPPAGQEEKKGLEELKKECQAEESQAETPGGPAEMEHDEESATRKRKLEELEEKRRVLAEENARMQEEIEKETKRIKSVEEAEQRAREQRAKNPKVRVPTEPEKAEKEASWFERKSAELVEAYIHGQPKQQEKSKNAEAVYLSACKDTEQAQEAFMSALKKVQDSAQGLQESMGKALEAAIEFGREDERNKVYTQAKAKCTKSEVPPVKARPQIPPGLQEKLRQEKETQQARKEREPVKPEQEKSSWRPRAQPAEEEPGKEWTEKVSEDIWKAERKLASDEKFLDCVHYPFSPDWQDRVRKELLDLAYRGFKKGENEEVYVTRNFGWQLRSSKEFHEIENRLQEQFGLRLVWKNTEVKGKSKAMDDWHCYPLGRGCMEKLGRYGHYTIQGSLPPSKELCSICWTSGHWRKDCPLVDLVSQLWEPALTVLVPGKKLRRFYPMRNVVCEKYKDERDEFRKYYPAVLLADYGAVDGNISETNKRKYKEEKRKYPDRYPEIEPPPEERGKGIFIPPKQAISHAESKSKAKQPDSKESTPTPKESMAKRTEELLEMQDSAKKRRTKVLEGGTKETIDVDADQETPSKATLPPGYWEDRPRHGEEGKEATKEVLRQKLEERKKEKIEEYHEKKRQIEGSKAKSEAKPEQTQDVEGKTKVETGPGPDEAGTPTAALELIVLIFLQLIINCTKLKQGSFDEKESKSYAQYPLEEKRPKLWKQQAHREQVDRMDHPLALRGAVKMLGRPPTFGGGKTEVYDFMDFKEQLYNILAYAEPKYAEAFKNNKPCLRMDLHYGKHCSGFISQVLGVSSVAQISTLEELVKEHIHLQLTDITTYAQVKESVLVVERTTRRVRESFTPKPFYHIGTPPVEFPEVFPMTSDEEDEVGGDDSLIRKKKKEKTNLWPKGHVKVVELGEDAYLRLQRKLRHEGKPYDKEALEDSARREHEWIERHLDPERNTKEQEVDKVRMVREEDFHDVAEWFVMDDTDGDDNWCMVGNVDSPDVIRAVQTEERVPKEGLELIILDSGSDASLLPCDHPEAVKVSSENTGVLLEDAQGNQIRSAGVVAAVIDLEQGDCGTDNKEKARVEAQPTEPSEQDHEKKNPEAGKDAQGSPYPIIQLDFMFLQGKQTERKTVEKVLKWVHSIGHLEEV